MLDSELFSRILEAEKFFAGSSYQETIEKARKLFDLGQTERVLERLEDLPGSSELLNSLIEKLKGKRVYNTLKKLNEKGLENNEEYLKALFSLGTHTMIEIGAGKGEYKMLLPAIYEKIGVVLFDMV